MSTSLIKLITDFLGIPKITRSAVNLISLYPGLSGIYLKTPKGGS